MWVVAVGVLVGFALGVIGVLVWGIVSILGCGLIFGWVVIVYVQKAKRVIEIDV